MKILKILETGYYKLCPNHPDCIVNVDTQKHFDCIVPFKIDYFKPNVQYLFQNGFFYPMTTNPDHMQIATAYEYLKEGWTFHHDCENVSKDDSDANDQKELPNIYKEAAKNIETFLDAIHVSPELKKEILISLINQGITFGLQKTYPQYTAYVSNFDHDI